MLIIIIIFPRPALSVCQASCCNWCMCCNLYVAWRHYSNVDFVLVNQVVAIQFVNTINNTSFIFQLWIIMNVDMFITCCFVLEEFRYKTIWFAMDISWLGWRRCLQSVYQSDWNCTLHNELDNWCQEIPQSRHWLHWGLFTVSCKSPVRFVLVVIYKIRHRFWCFVAYLNSSQQECKYHCRWQIQQHWDSVCIS